MSVLSPRAKWWKLFLRHEPELRDIAIRFKAVDALHWEHLIVDRNINVLGEVLQTAWENAPDQPWIHSIPGWHVLCDLCSDYVFGEI